MTFDNIIIGGGLAGLVCGITLQRHGGRNLIVSSGQSALHFCSGSFDLLSSLPDGTAVDSPTASYDQLIAQNPEHPYAKLGYERFSEIAMGVKDFLADANIMTSGTPHRNHLRISPLGKLCSTWLTFDGFATSQSAVDIRDKRVAVVAFEGVNDFYPHKIAEAFGTLEANSESTTKHTSASDQVPNDAKPDIVEVNLEAMSELRSLPAPKRLADIARAFGNAKFVEGFAYALARITKEYDVVILPDAISFDNIHARAQLETLIGKTIIIASSFPPSVSGIGAQRLLCRRFEQLGGIYMLGDQITKTVVKNNRIESMFSENHGTTPLCAKNVVLASGSFFSKGLCASQNEIFEPLFGIDLFTSADRDLWCDERMLGKHAYNTFGARTSSTFKASKDEQTIDNLHACGSLLGGYDPLNEGAGAGVAIISGIAVAENIINDR